MLNSFALIGLCVTIHPQYVPAAPKVFYGKLHISERGRSNRANKRHRTTHAAAMETKRRRSLRDWKTKIHCNFRRRHPTDPERLRDIRTDIAVLEYVGPLQTLAPIADDAYGISAI